MDGLMTVVRELAGWLGVILSIVGLVVACMALGHSRWAIALAAGFGIDSMLGLFYRVATPLLSRGTLGPASFQGVFVVTTLLGVVGTAAMVAGVAGVLSELKARQP